nr:hypothetical protein [Clostridium saccharoperbutylacetonicum]
MHNSAEQSKSSSIPGLSALSEIGKTKDKLEKRVKAKLFLGIVEILAMIFSEKEEKLNNISSAGATFSAISTASAINIAQDAIQAVRGGTASTGIDSYSPRVIDDGPSTPPLIPPAVDDGPSTPPLIPPAIDDGPSTPPLTPPVIDNGPSTPPLIPPAPDDGPSTPPLIPPAHKELEDMILFNSYNNLPNKGVWPKWNEGTDTIGEFKKKLDTLFGEVGNFIKDGPRSQGRKRYEWVLPNGTVVWWERHPYDRKNGAPSSHTEPHYHVNTSSDPHGKGFEGTD